MIAILQNITEMLAVNEQVIIISMDLTKAFDSISHSPIPETLDGLDIPDSIYNWLVEYLKDIRHFTSFEGKISSVAVINASVVQGSVVGPQSSSSGQQARDQFHH